ncbi:GH39 family glycosyl hydrolase [Pedobacter jejuensis]|uniref:Beta-xylosidase n=1 Tax=Pedobacter jejuensis TaxID=1268550 RepID=A0A3N0BVH3_9SPHI|nr:beta-xylosidase [Pedobacter jejuensis]RNL53425.1 beta-xylosidase [Pedobacter jejuensis]
MQLPFKEIPIKCLSLVLIFLLPFRLFAQKPTIDVDFNKEIAPMKPVWSWFGYDEPNYTYMKDGKKLLTQLAATSKNPVYVRTHSLLVTGDGIPDLKWGSTNAYTEDANGNPIYNFKIIDKIFDSYVSRGMKPLVQIGFMPEALSTHPQPYKHHWKPGDPYKDIITGWAYPPKDYNKWRTLVYEWAKHSIERYGKKEVESWYWEVWNEPNGDYWKGTQEEFFKLYDYAADGLKQALPTARIGGPNIAGTRGKTAQQWLNNFIEHCTNGINYATGKKGAPLEAILFHAKGSPKFVNGYVKMNMAAQLNDIYTGFKIAASYPNTKNLPIIIGESDPEGCAACGMATNPENAYRNGTAYSSYTAAVFARKYMLADLTKVNFLGAVSWAFEFENQPWFFGFRDLATNGVEKPVLNVFRMFGQMGNMRLAVQGNRMYELDDMLKSSVSGEQSDIGALATKSEKSIAIMTWNYHDDDKKSNSETLKLRVNNLPSTKAMMSIYLIDSKNSNSYEVWKAMGSPGKPTQAQINTLKKSAKLKCVQKKMVDITGGEISVPVELERQAVALIKLDW